MVECYVAAALHAREAGADGVEVHGAQGHLIGQFVSPFSNRREDRYGGSLDTGCASRPRSWKRAPPDRPARGRRLPDGR
jgi:hypothetical protein